MELKVGETCLVIFMQIRCEFSSTEMRSCRITPAVVRDGTRLRFPRPGESPLMLSDNCTLLEMSGDRAARAIKVQKRQSMPAIARAAAHRVLSLLGLL